MKEENDSAETGGVQVVGTQIFIKMIVLVLSGGRPQEILGLGLQFLILQDHHPFSKSTNPVQD